MVGALVRVVQVDGPIRDLQTDHNGAFRIEATGPFQLEITHPGFRTVRTGDIALAAEAVFEIDDIALSPGNPSDIEQIAFQIDNVDELNKPTSIL